MNILQILDYYIKFLQTQTSNYRYRETKKEKNKKRKTFTYIQLVTAGQIAGQRRPGCELGRICIESRASRN